jgi:hypothetical protein
VSPGFPGGTWLGDDDRAADVEQRRTDPPWRLDLVRRCRVAVESERQGPGHDDTVIHSVWASRPAVNNRSVSSHGDRGSSPDSRCIQLGCGHSGASHKEAKMSEVVSQSEAVLAVSVDAEESQAIVVRRDQRGMVSAEWAVGIIAAVAVAGVLLAVVTTGGVKNALLSFIVDVISSFSGYIVHR